MNILKKLVAGVAMILCFSTPAFAHPGKMLHNHVFLEAGGNGIYWTINYERMFTDNISGRIGLGYMPNNDNVFTAPVMVNYLWGDTDHKVELGIGVLFVGADSDINRFNGNLDQNGVGGTATLGYRFQPAGECWTFRAGYTPFFGLGGYQNWGGISFGYAF